MEAKLEKESEDILSRIYGYLHEGGEGDFFRLYSSSTENISGYLPIFELSERKLWTLGSSFDHPINAALAGCREITVLDICPQTTIFSYLKRAALNTLKRQEFIRFFSIYLTEPDRRKGKDNQDFLSGETFKKVKNELESLDKVSYEVWNDLIGWLNPQAKIRLFRTDCLSGTKTKKCNLYLQDDDMYKKARYAIDKAMVDIIIGDCMETPIENADVIFLTNIRLYIGEKRWVQLLERAVNALNDDGQIMADYTWGEGLNGSEFEQVVDVMLQKILIDRAFPRESANDRATTDKILYYTNSKKKGPYL